MIGRTLSALTALTLAGCTAELPLHTEFVPGMSKAEVLQKFGEPDSTDLMQTNLRVDRYGEVPLPEPEYTEIWRYMSRHNYDPASAVRIDGETFLSFSPNAEETILSTGWLSNQSLQISERALSQ